MYDNIIYGSGYAAVGYCLGHKGNNLIISQNVYADELTPSLISGSCSYKTEAGKKIFEMFEKNGIVSEDLCDSVKGMSLLCNISEKNNINYLMQTFVTDVSVDNEKFTLRVLNDEGFSDLTCKNYIDMRTRNGKKYLACAVRGKNRNCVPFYDRRYSILRFAVEENEGYSEARLRLQCYLNNTGLEPIITAVEFGYDKNCESPFELFEKGYSGGMESAAENN